MSQSMTQPRTTAAAACVSVFDTGGSVQFPGRPSQWEDATSGDVAPAPAPDPAPDPAPRTLSPFGEKQPPPLVPVTRGPYDCWHTEKYLVGWLVKGHGWRVLEPGVLVKGNLQREAG